jgi:hypothetical protein
MQKASSADVRAPIVLAIVMGAYAADNCKTVPSDSALGKSNGMAAEVAHGRCT